MVLVATYRRLSNHPSIRPPSQTQPHQATDSFNHSRRCKAETVLEIAQTLRFTCNQIDNESTGYPGPCRWWCMLRSEKTIINCRCSSASDHSAAGLRVIIEVVLTAIGLTRRSGGRLLAVAQALHDSDSPDFPAELSEVCWRKRG